MSTSAKHVQKLLGNLKVADRLQDEDSPGFSHALHLNPDRLLPQNFYIERNQLTYRHIPPPEICLGEDKVSLGTYLAVLHDVTTWALMFQGKRPGLSVNLRAEWGPAGNTIVAGQAVDIISTVQKMDRTLGFVKADVFQRDQQLVTFGGHVKFLQGSAFVDGLFARAFSLVKCYAKLFGSKPHPQTFELKELFRNLKFRSFDEATFMSSSAHAGFDGALHGGCQAILMELVGEQTARDVLSVYSVVLESININYLSASSPSIKLNSEVLIHDVDYVKMKVTIRARTMANTEGGRIISEGLLQWRPSDAVSPASPSAFSNTAAGSRYRASRRTRYPMTDLQIPGYTRTSYHVQRIPAVSEESCTSVYTTSARGQGERVASASSTSLRPPSCRPDSDDGEVPTNVHVRREVPRFLDQSLGSSIQTEDYSADMDILGVYDPIVETQERTPLGFPRRIDEESQSGSEEQRAIAQTMQRHARQRNAFDPFDSDSEDDTYESVEVYKGNAGFNQSRFADDMNLSGILTVDVTEIPAASASTNLSGIVTVDVAEVPHKDTNDESYSSVPTVDVFEIPQFEDSVQFGGIPSTTQRTGGRILW